MATATRAHVWSGFRVYGPDGWMGTALGVVAGEAPALIVRSGLFVERRGRIPAHLVDVVLHDRRRVLLGREPVSSAPVAPEREAPAAGDESGLQQFFARSAAARC